jgi:hypothetical protein
MRITALSSTQYVVGVETPNGRYKLFQIICKDDGSLIIPLPYYKHASAQLIEGTFKAGEAYAEGLTVSGPVTTHRVKYTHHASGEAHFSQDGKILTRVRKQANTLAECNGHLFTVQLQGLHHFAKVAERDLRNSRRVYVFLRYKRELTSLKIVAQLMSPAQLKEKFVVTSSNTSPWFRLVVEGKIIPAVLLSTRSDSGLNLLSLSFEEIPTVSADQESIFTFMGGFDHPSIALDHSRDSTFLMLISPAGKDPVQAAQLHGTVDYNP